MPFAAHVSACTRPIRAANKCLMPAALIFAAALMAVTVYASAVEPLQDLRKTWTQTTCTFSGPASVSKSGRWNVRRRNDRWSISQPVTVLLPDGPTGGEWPAIAHRWPSTLAMGDGSVKGLYSWWLSIGGTGEVLEPPSGGWLGREGKFRFTTPPNLKVPCWFVREPDYRARPAPLPLRVRLSDEPVSQLFYWATIALTVPMMGVLVVGALFHKTCGAYRDEWQRLEEVDREVHV
jgi:hypothetical protein